jgi:hypothetical protein
VKPLAVVVLLAACAGAARPAPPPQQSSPRLVVLVVVDQWPEWAFEQKRAALTGGFARLLAEGEWRVGRYPSAATLTGPSHALLGTGVAPAGSGIVADSWWHRDLDMLLEAVHDADGSVTPKWLRVPALADVMATARSRGRAVGIAFKPRAAVLPLGRHGTSIWYDEDTTRFRSFSSIAWLDEWNRAHPIAPRLQTAWTPSDPDRIAALAGVPDAQPGETGIEGFGPTFPHDPQATKAPSKALRAMPLADELLLELATHALEAEALGTHADPDLLVVGVSTHDIVGHGWGQESREMWDLELRFDVLLARFMDELDRRVGAGRWAMIVTGDHGASPLPERVGGGRIPRDRLRRVANAAAAEVLGDGTWILSAEYPTLYYGSVLRALSDETRAPIEARVLAAMRAFPGIERAGRVADVTGDCFALVGDERALCLTFDVERSGELYYLPARNWIIDQEDEPAATAHGSLHDYDRLVPVVVLAPDRARHAPLAAPTPVELDMRAIAPLVARWLGVAR